MARSYQRGGAGDVQIGVGDVGGGVELLLVPQSPDVQDLEPRAERRGLDLGPVSILPSQFCATSQIPAKAAPEDASDHAGEPAAGSEPKSPDVETLIEWKEKGGREAACSPPRLGGNRMELPSRPPQPAAQGRADLTQTTAGPFDRLVTTQCRHSERPKGVEESLVRVTFAIASGDSSIRYAHSE